MNHAIPVEPSSTERVDVVIVGAGPVGLTLAALLARASDWQVRVLDARTQAATPREDRIDPRVFALSRASQNILARVAAWPQIQPHAWPYRRMRVWDGSVPYDEARALTFDAAELAEPDLGHIVENVRIEQALRQALRGALDGHERTRILQGARLQWLQLQSEGATVFLEDGRSLQTRLVVGADGASSATRELAGIAVWKRDYRQRSIVTHVTTAHGHRQTAWQRFLPSGPLALLPLGDGRCCVIWSADDALAEELLAADDADFCARLGAASESVLGEITACEARLSFPLQILHAREYCARRLALIGDAAHVVHPLAGQGVNLGLLDAAALAECLVNEKDPGERRVLRRYERWRKSENTLMLAALDSLQRVFSLSSPPLTGLRAMGLGVVNRLRPVRREFMRRALGVAGELPKAARDFR